MKAYKFYIKAPAKTVPMDILIHKDSPDVRARKKLVEYILTNKIKLYNNGEHEVVQYAKKLLYLIDPKGKISFIDPKTFVYVGFNTVEEMQDFIKKIKNYE